MQPNKNLTALFLTIFTLTISFAQVQESAENTYSLKEGSIEQQFEYIARISSNYNDKGKRYEVINRVNYLTLKSNVIDSIRVLENQITESKSIIDAQQKANSTIQTELDNTKSTLETTNSEKDKISLFGMQLSKSFYNVLLWSIIGVLIVLLFTFIFKYRSSNITTKAAKKTLEDTELEFEDHRRIALEREQKVRRQLQDEINKQKGNSK